MGFIAFLLALWVICVLFPGGGGGYVDVAGALVNLVLGVVGFIALVFFWGYGVAGILWLAQRWQWNGSFALILALLGPIAIPMLIASAARASLEYLAYRKAQRI